MNRLYGKYSGEVVDDRDENQRGALKVKVPAVLDELEVWARPCLPYGHFFIPPVGTKLWVEFEGGDTAHPLWVGTWYADGEVPAPARVSPPSARVLQTASGHSVELDDTAGEERVLVRHKADSFVSVDKDGSVLVANQKGANLYLNARDGQATLTAEHGHMVTLTGDGITLATREGVTLELTAAGKVKVNAAKGVQVIGGEISLSGSSILLGGAQALFTPLVMEKFLPLFMAHTHVTPVGPSGPPVPPIPPVPEAVGSKSVKVAP
jgi:phage gp45-like